MAQGQCMLVGPLVNIVGLDTTVSEFEAGYGGTWAWGAPCGSGLSYRRLRTLRITTVCWGASEAGPQTVAINAFFVVGLDNPCLAYQVRRRVTMCNRINLGTWSKAEQAAWTNATIDMEGAVPKVFAWIWSSLPPMPSKGVGNLPFWSVVVRSWCDLVRPRHVQVASLDMLVVFD